MKAIVRDEYVSSDLPRLEDVSIPTPAAKELLQAGEFSVAVRRKE